MSSSDAVCWCAGDIKCPHAFASKLPLQWEDMEKSIDEVLQKFDRKTIKRYLKRDIDGNEKGEIDHTTKMKETYFSKSAFSMNTNMSTDKFSKTRFDERPSSSGGILVNNSLHGGHGEDFDFLPHNNQYSNDNDILRPRTTDAVPSLSNSNTRPSTSRLAAKLSSSLALSQTLPTLPLASSYSNSKLPNKSIMRSQANLNAKSNSNSRSGMLSQVRGEPVQPPELGDAAATVMVDVGLVGLASGLCRTALPWQAACCPRAVEALRDARLQCVLRRHEAFMRRMGAQLTEKVLRGFVEAKDGEVGIWAEAEVQSWQHALHGEEDMLDAFVMKELKRIAARASAHEEASRAREVGVTTGLDGTERDSMREQLVNYRRLCRGTDSNSAVGMDVRALHANIETAQAKATAQINISAREVVRRVEEAHDWLMCLADNAVTAAESEASLKELYSSLDMEKERAMVSLHAAIETYSQQHQQISDAITIFSGRIHQYAADFLRREQLISRGFVQYSLGVLSGDIRPHSSTQRRSAVAWEGKTAADRAHKMDQSLLKEFNLLLQSFDALVKELRERMRVHSDVVNAKMRAVLLGRDNDVNKRKVIIHKKLAKFVNKECNNRRVRLKAATNSRRTEFSIEERCASALAGFTSELRLAADDTWVHEHLRERRMTEASVGRLRRLEQCGLLLWRKHAHLASPSDMREDCEDWLRAYRSDRSMRNDERVYDLNKHWKQFQSLFNGFVKTFVLGLSKPLKALVHASCTFTVRDAVHPEGSSSGDSLEEALQETTLRCREEFTKTADSVSFLSSQISDFIDKELHLTNINFISMQDNLILEWQEQLLRLNTVINRRIASLKDMEYDLEETIRLTLAQHEVECVVFEQTSCTRCESFWLDWKSKFTAVRAEISEDYADYLASKQSGRIKGRKSRSDRKIDEILSLPNAIALNNSSIGKSKQGQHQHEEHEQEHLSMSDCTRLKSILDEIRTEPYKEFTHKVSKSLDTLRRDQGEGRGRSLIPPAAAMKILFSACDAFWDSAKLSERCIGRMASKGKLLFSRGLPPNARALFCIGSACQIMCTIAMNPSNHCIEVEAVLGSLDSGVKRVFLAGLLNITLHFGGYGETMLKSECLWACSVCGINPPPDLIESLKFLFLDPNITNSNTKSEKRSFHFNSSFSDANNVNQHMKYSFLNELTTAGFYSDDPIDLVNNVLSVPNISSSHEEHSDEINSKANNTTHSSSSKNTTGFHSNGNFRFAETSYQEHLRNFADLSEREPMDVVLPRILTAMPAVDGTILSCLLGRPGAMFETTPHRFCQAVALWRRAAIAIAAAAADPPGVEYPRMVDIIAQHSANKAGKRKLGYSNIVCISPFAAVSASIEWITSIQGLPLSVLSALTLLSKGGSCDIWLEDPKQSCRGMRFYDELKEFLDVMSSSAAACNYPKTNDCQRFVSSLEANIQVKLKPFDVNGSGYIPLELLRSYIQREDPNVSNNQISAIYWCVSRGRLEHNSSSDNSSSINELTADVNADISKINANDSTLNDDLDEGNTQISMLSSVVQATSGGQSQAQTNAAVKYGAIPTVRRVVETEFKGNDSEYMEAFSRDVASYLETMPSLDTNIVLGSLPMALSSAAAHEILADAMKLDASARNHTPPTCCIWLGATVLPQTEAISLVTIDHTAYTDNPVQQLYIGIGPTLTCESKSNDNLGQIRLRELRSIVELDFLTKYPSVCNNKTADDVYSAAGGPPIKQDDHWKELVQRRMTRTERLLYSWRDTMLNEWANSLYSSRQKRYETRAQVVYESIKTYHKQYAKLKESIVDDRRDLLQHYPTLMNELKSVFDIDKDFLVFHSSYLDRSVSLLKSRLDFVNNVFRDVLLQFQRHCGSIRHKALARVDNAQLRLKNDLETACEGLIVGYTGGYAQAFFDELLYKGEILRKRITDMHGLLILEKEKFVYSKEELERDLTFQIADRITLDRARTKGLLEALSADSASIQEALANTRAGYASIQKDANARLVIRIEKAVREARKLRTAAEQMPELEELALREIRIIINTALTTCRSVVDQIKIESIKQLRTVEPLRKGHRETMAGRVNTLMHGWEEVEEVLLPMIANFKNEAMEHLSIMKTKCMDNISAFREEETSSFNKAYRKERSQLIQSFRSHFKDYDLSESFIFEKYNIEVLKTVGEIKATWGPSRPKFITDAIAGIDRVASESMKQGSHSVALTIQGNASDNDDLVLQRMEIADLFTYAIMQYTSAVADLPERFVKEHRSIVDEIGVMTMNNNGDMIRPQVEAVMDLLISGIEIESDFTKGFDSLIASTHNKASDAHEELSDFVTRYGYNNKIIPGSSNATAGAGPTASIPAAVDQIVNRLERRKEEVKALLDAMNAHLVADHSRLDVIFHAAEKDIEEWASLTSQLIENAFASAEENYLSAIFPTPPSTPRPIIETLLPLSKVGIDESDERVEKLKMLLRTTQQQVGSPSTSPAMQSKLQKPLDLSKLRLKSRPPDIKTRDLDELSIASMSMTMNQTGDMKELQEGWLECYTPEGYTFYFNPDTGESLWDLPNSLKRPLNTFIEDEIESVRLIETPRELLQLYDMNPNSAASLSSSPQQQRQQQKVAVQYITPLAAHPEIVMSDLAEEARAIANGAMQTALEVSSVIRGTVRSVSRPPKPGRIAVAAGAGAVSTPVVAASKATVFTPRDDLYSDDGSGNDFVDLSRLRGGDDDDISATDSSNVQDAYHNRLQSSHYVVSVGDGDGGSDRGRGGGSAVRAGYLMAGLHGDDAFGSSPEASVNNSSAVVNEWRTEGMGSGNVSTGTGMPETDKTSKKNREIEERYYRTREVDLMSKEDSQSRDICDYYEEIDKHDFYQHLQTLLTDGNSVIAVDIAKLKLKAKRLRKLTIIETFAELDCSWELLDRRLHETLAAEDEARKYAESLKTEAGRQRQKMVLEHQEDIDDMTDFLKAEGGLSKTIARKAATEAVVMKMTTPKKMAKLWLRQAFELAALGIDDDDQEDVEIALRKLVEDNNLSTSVPSRGSSPLRSMTPAVHPAVIANGNNNNNSGISTRAQTTDQKSSSSPQLATPTFQPNNNNNNKYKNSNTGIRAAALSLDPAIFQEVEEEYDVADENSVLMQINHLQAADEREKEVDNLADPDPWVNFKSFKGGWIEGISSDGHIYYYNTVTGESTWKLPQGAHPISIEQFDRNQLQLDSSVPYPSTPASSFHIARPRSRSRSNSNGIGKASRGQSWDSNGAGNVDSVLEESSYSLDGDNNDLESVNKQQQMQQEEASIGTGAAGYSNDDDSSYQQQQLLQYQYQDEGVYNSYDYSNDNPLQDVLYAQNENNYEYDDGNNSYSNSTGEYTGDDDYGTPSYHTGTASSPSNNKGTSSSLSSSKIPSRNNTLRRRLLPIITLPEVASYSREEGVARQLQLMNSQETWQNALVKTQYFITEQKAKYLKLKEDLFSQATQRVETRLGIFVEDIKYMQKALKKEIGNLNATERDLRNQFDKDNSSNPNVNASNSDRDGPTLRAERLSQILDGIEKLKVNSNSRYDSSYRQMEKFAADWSLIRVELLQVGDIYDEQVASSLEQCRLACDHEVKLFLYDQTKHMSERKIVECRSLRNGLRLTLRNDTFEAESARENVAARHYEHNMLRQAKRRELQQELIGWESMIEPELEKLDLAAIDPLIEMRPEEEIVMSFMLKQIEMEMSLSDDFDSINIATGDMGVEMMDGVVRFDELEKQTTFTEGSWFNKHREAVERHAQALNVTLQRVQSKIDDGYRLLNSKIEALDYDVERAAEDELAAD